MSTVPYYSHHQQMQTKLEDCLTCPYGLDQDYSYEMNKILLDLILTSKDSLDNFLQKAARMMNKTVGGCETAKDRCDLARFRVDLVLDKLEKTLSLLESNNMTEYINSGIERTNLYRCVSLEESLDLNDDDIIEEFRYYQIYERNRLMADKVADLIQSSPETKLFVAFEIFHFSHDSESVVELLRGKGFQVERVYAFETI